MVDEKDEYSGEEGEYHYSDDQTNYDLGGENTSKADTTAKAAGVALTGINKYRRYIVLGVVGLVLMLGLYRFLSPGYTPQATDFTQTAIETPNKPVQLVSQKKTVTTKTIAPSTVIAQNPSAPPIQDQTEQTEQPNGNTQGLGLPQLPDTAANTNHDVNAPPLGKKPSMPGMTTAPSNDQVASIAEENAKLSNLVQVEYAQKMADYASQEAATQAKLQELNSRVASMETVITQLTQLLQNTAKTNKPAAANNTVRAPKMIYSVQAIIPGRAWLKTESGDTVTVAEGDVLKEYGRISKIDPYDGVVMIDTGSKILTLSYGSSADATS